MVSKGGAITIPSVAHRKPAGHFATMKSFAGGLQLHVSGGFKAQYVIEAPQAGKYALAARVATVHEGQKFLFGKGEVLHHDAEEAAILGDVGNPVEGMKFFYKWGKAARALKFQLGGVDGVFFEQFIEPGDED